MSLFLDLGVSLVPFELEAYSALIEISLAGRLHWLLAPHSPLPRLLTAQ